MIPISRELVYYKDAGCTDPFPYDKKRQKQVILSPNAVRVGESGSMIVYLRNESKNEWVITGITLGHESLKLDINKKTIKSGEKAEIVLNWHVPENLTVPYQTGFIIEGEFIIRS